MNKILLKLWLFISIFVAIIMAILWYFQVQQIETTYLEQRKELLLAEATNLALLTNTTELNDTLNQAEVDEIKLRIKILAEKDAAVFFMNEEDKILSLGRAETLSKSKVNLRELRVINFNKILPGPYNPLLKDRLISRSKTSPTLSVFDDGAGKHRTILATAPIYDKDIYKGKVIIISATAPIDKTIQVIKNQLGTITIILLCIGSLLAFALSIIITRPLKQISTATHNIGQGDFNIKIDVSTKDELGDLARDIERMSKLLAEKDTLRKEFIGNVSHDLKTPITLIQTYTELLHDTSPSVTCDDKDNLKVIIEESARLDKMVDDLLYLSKIEADAPEVNIQRTCVEGLVSLSVQSIQHLLSKSNIEVRIKTQGNPFPIDCDEDQMRRVMINLMQNAIRHAGQIDHIDLGLNYLQDRVVVHVQDHGKGIASDALPRIWDRFYRVDTARTSNGKSTGLGMAIVQNILQNHGFVFGIESQLGSGTKVWFECPKPS